MYLSICLHHLQFLSSRSYSYRLQIFCLLGRFIPRYCILLGAMVNEIVFLIYLSDVSLLMYRNAVDFCMLILYLTTLPSSLMNPGSFLMVSLGFSMYSIISSAFSCLFPLSLLVISSSLMDLNTITCQWLSHSHPQPRCLSWMPSSYIHPPACSTFHWGI